MTTTEKKEIKPICNDVSPLCEKKKTRTAERRRPRVTATALVSCCRTVPARSRSDDHIPRVEILFFSAHPPTPPAGDLVFTCLFKTVKKIVFPSRIHPHRPPFTHSCTRPSARETTTTTTTWFVDVILAGKEEKNHPPQQQRRFSFFFSAPESHPNWAASTEQINSCCRENILYDSAIPLYTC